MAEDRVGFFATVGSLSLDNRDVGGRYFVSREIFSTHPSFTSSRSIELS